MVVLVLAVAPMAPEATVAPEAPMALVIGEASLYGPFDILVSIGPVV